MLNCYFLIVYAQIKLMSIFHNVFNSYLDFINAFKQNILKIKNENEKSIDNISSQFIERSEVEPCRSCTDFRTFSRMRRQEFSQNLVQSVPSKDYVNETRKIEYQREDCPLDKDELGRCTWKLLHTIAATYSDEPSPEEQSNIEQFIRLLPKVYPCEICANDLSEIIKYHPPNISSQKTFAYWMCEVHNMVNKKLEKPLFDCSKINERWRDGWSDGHCD